MESITGNLYLLGFMGSGKTTVGKALAQVLNRRFLDMDEQLSELLGRSIPEVFRQEGEGRFRDAESALMRELSNRKTLVISTGGGILQKPENRRLMRQSGKTVYLDASLQTCEKRLSTFEKEKRPLWSSPARLKDLYEQRRRLYEACDIHVIVDGRSSEEVVAIIVSELLAETRFPVILGPEISPVICTWQADRILKEWTHGRQVFLLSDQTVHRLYAERFSEALGSPPTFLIRPGERSKSLQTASRIYQQLLENRIERGGCLVALGGGVVTDLGAFVSATFKRGIPFVLISTTLLGCVDAAIGGKSAVNMKKSKNVIGCFTAPAAVLLDIHALKTLSRKRILEGLSEAYKTGLVSSPEIVEYIDRYFHSLSKKDLVALHGLVTMTAKAKADVVSRDYREDGPRRILNFGHTLGHAVEEYAAFRMSHGEAVALGMTVAVRISENRGLLAGGQSKPVLSTLKKLIPRRFQCPAPADLLELMKNDKKVESGRIVFVLLEDIGKPLIVDDVSLSELARAMDTFN